MKAGVLIGHKATAGWYIMCSTYASPFKKRTEGALVGMHFLPKTTKAQRHAHGPGVHARSLISLMRRHTSECCGCYGNTFCRYGRLPFNIAASACSCCPTAFSSHSQHSLPIKLHSCIIKMCREHLGTQQVSQTPQTGTIDPVQVALTKATKRSDPTVHNHQPHPQSNALLTQI